MKKATVAVGNRRLLKLAAFLRTVPRERFNYAEFVGWDWQGAQDLSCGTKGCALGWAATMPEFRRLGLHLAKGTGSPTITGRDNPWLAAEKLFGIERYEAYELFSPSYDFVKDIDENYATPKYVARKLEQFVKARVNDSEG